MSTRPAAKSSILFGQFYLEVETLLYVVLSIADLLITNFLLRQNPEGFRFVESNPVAKYFLDHWGPKGMIYFKFGMVALVCIITQIVARYRPLTARLVLFFAIGMMIYVVVYSMRLYAAHAGGVGSPPMDSSSVHEPRIQHSVQRG